MSRVRNLIAAIAITMTVGVGDAAASCHSFGCLNKQVSSLNHQVSSLKGQVSSLQGSLRTTQSNLQTTQTNLQNTETSLFNTATTAGHTASAFNTLIGCLQEVPITDYGDPAGSFGYLYTPDGVNSIATSAVDVTNSGDPIGAWLLSDACNTVATGSARFSGHAVAHALAPAKSVPAAQRH